jgi:hypothetical protein
MSNRIIFANSISFVAAVFLAVSCVVKERRLIYFFQLCECIILLFAQLVFGQGAAAVSLMLGVVRNLLLWRGKYRAVSAALVFVFTLILGVLFNTGGYVGFIPIIASLIFALSSYFAKTYIKVKLSLLINLSLWTVYSFVIFDLTSFFVNLISMFLNSISLVRFLSKRNREDGEKHKLL